MVFLGFVSEALEWARRLSGVWVQGFGRPLGLPWLLGALEAILEGARVGVGLYFSFSIAFLGLLKRLGCWALATEVGLTTTLIDKKNIPK